MIWRTMTCLIYYKFSMDCCWLNFRRCRKGVDEAMHKRSFEEYARACSRASLTCEGRFEFAARIDSPPLRRETLYQWNHSFQPFAYQSCLKTIFFIYLIFLLQFFSFRNENNKCKNSIEQNINLMKKTGASGNRIGRFNESKSWWNVHFFFLSFSLSSLSFSLDFHSADSKLPDPKITFRLRLVQWKCWRFSRMIVSALFEVTTTNSQFIAI